MPTSAAGSLEESPPICLPLTTPGLTLARVGGKGLNLARLAVAGFQVPAFSFLIPLFIPPIIAGYASLGLLTRIASFLAGANPGITPELALELTRSLPNNVTTEMDLELWKVATRIKEDSAAAAAFAASDAADLAGRYKRKQLPAAIQSALDSFLDQYGMRGLAELDFGQPRWRELPDPIIRALQSYLAIPDREMAPDRVFRKGRREAASAEARLAKAAATAWGAKVGPWLVHLLARRLRALAGFRESPKFTMIRIIGNGTRGAPGQRPGTRRKGHPRRRRQSFLPFNSGIEDAGARCAGKLEEAGQRAQNCRTQRTQTPAHPPPAAQ